MNEKSLIDKEWKMVEEYQRKQNENIALYFYEKYGNDICNIVFYKISCKFSSIPLERNDLLSFVWKGIKNALKTVNIKNKDKLMGCFVKQSYFKSVREALKFLTNGHIVLNNAESLEKINDDKVNLKSKDGIVYQEIKYEILREELIKQIAPKIQGYNQKIIQRIIYLKSLGYSLKEISEKINLSLKTTKNIYQVIVKIGKLFYKN